MMTATLSAPLGGAATFTDTGSAWPGRKLAGAWWITLKMERAGRALDTVTARSAALESLPETAGGKSAFMAAKSWSMAGRRSAQCPRSTGRDPNVMSFRYTFAARDDIASHAARA